MASQPGVKQRWLTDREADGLARIIRNFFMKASSVIVNVRSQNAYTHQLEKEKELSPYLSDVEHNNSFDVNHDIKFKSNVFANPKSTVSSAEKTSYSSSHVRTQSQKDMWFNLETSASDVLLNFDFHPWEIRDITLLPPMIIETVLDLTGISEFIQLYLEDNIITTKKKSEIVLERWLIKLDLNNYDNELIDLPLIYKNLIVLFRCLYTLIGLLPASKLTESNLQDRVKLKILNGSKAITSKGRFGLSRPLVSNKPEVDIVESKDLLPVLTPIGSLDLSVSYRKNCNFRLYENINIDAIDKSETHNYESQKAALVNSKFKASNTSINSLNMKRRSSARPGVGFRSRSMTSSISISPPVAPLASNLILGTYPIPVKRNDSSSSVHFYHNNSGDKIEQLQHGLMTSPIPGKAPSSVGSKLRNSGSRNNSLEGKLTTTANNVAAPYNPILHHFKTKNKNIMSSSSDIEINNSISLDDDLNNFMKLLESKPDLRISNNSSSIYEDSLSNFKDLKKNNDLFIDSSLKDSFAYSRSISSSTSPSKPPPLVGDQNTLDSTVKLLLDSKHSQNQTQSFQQSQSELHQQTQKQQMGNSGQSHKVRTYSRSSRGSKGSHGSRDSRGSIGLIHHPSSPKSGGITIAGIGATPNQSVHSVLKASATSESFDTVAQAPYSLQMERGVSLPSFSPPIDYDKNFKVASNAASSVSPTTSHLTQHMALSSSMGRAQSLLRNLSGQSQTSFNSGLRGRAGSGSSVTGSQLRSILQNSLNNDAISSRSSRKYSSSDASGKMTPQQLKDISYKQDVFTSDDDGDGIDDMTDDSKSRKGSTARTRSKRAESLSNVLNNLKNMQRRQSMVVKGTVCDVEEEDEEGGHLLYLDDEGGNNQEGKGEEEEEEDDGLLFEMSDMPLSRDL